MVSLASSFSLPCLALGDLMAAEAAAPQRQLGLCSVLMTWEVVFSPATVAGRVHSASAAATVIE